MKWSEIKNKRLIKYILNSYILISIVFIVWMYFFDENNYRNHAKFNKEIKELENSINIYKKKIAQDEAMIKRLQDTLQLERFAREKYLMKKDNEDVFIIDVDSVKK